MGAKSLLDRVEVENEFLPDAAENAISYFIEQDDPFLITYNSYPSGIRIVLWRVGYLNVYGGTQHHIIDSPDTFDGMEWVELIVNRALDAGLPVAIHRDIRIDWIKPLPVMRIPSLDYLDDELQYRVRGDQHDLFLAKIKYGGV